MNRSLVAMVGTVLAVLSIAACTGKPSTPGGLDGAAVPPPPTATSANSSGSGNEGGMLNPTPGIPEREVTPTP